MNYDYASNQQTIYANNGGTTLSEYIEYTAQQPTWTKSYVYLGDSILSTLTPNGSGGENTEFNHPDRLGTRTITNQAAGTSSEQATLPFGRALNAESTRTNNPNRFTSYDRSNISGLDYAVNRSYDSKQGRFTQVDPIKMGASSLASPQTLNLYTYCGNDPINHTDPDGLFFGSLFRWIGKILKAVMIAVAVALIVIALVLMPSVAPLVGYTVFAKMFAAAGVLLAQALAPPKIGAIIGIVTGLILAGPGIIVNFAETINKMARWQKLLMASNFVGAIANSFAQKKKDEKKRRGIIEQTVSRVVSRLNKGVVAQSKES